MKTFKITLSVLIMASTSMSFAQDDADDTHTVAITIPQVALVDIEPSASRNLTLAFVAPTEAGLPLTDPDDDTSLWLNYSSIKSGAAITNSVSVKLDALLPGVDILVSAGAYAGTGDGDVGTPAGAALTLTVADQTIVSAIGSSYTGDGTTNGHNLTYSVEGATTAGIANYEDLVASAGTSVTVTYTISDN